MRGVKYSICGLLVCLLSACGAPTAGNVDTAARTNDQQTAARSSAAPAASTSIITDQIPTRVTLPSVAPLAPNAEQQAAMQDPQDLIRYWADQLQREQYDAIEPLLTPSLRQAFALQQPGGIAAFYREQTEQYGALNGTTVVGQRTPYDSDALVALDTDLAYANTMLKLELDVAQTEQGWQIDNFGPRSDRPLPSIELSQDVRDKLAEPQAAARFFLDLIQQQQYAQLEPLFTMYARQTAGTPIDQAYLAEAQRIGTLQSYEIVDSRARQENGDEFYEIDADLQYERQLSNVKIVLAKTPQGWKVNHVVPRG